MVFVNPHKGQAALEIGGEERLLVINMNVIAQIEEATGVRLIDFDAKDDAKKEELERQTSGINFLRHAIAACLSNKQRTVRPETVGLWLSESIDKLIEAKQSFTKALDSFFSALIAEHKKKHPPTEEAPKTEAATPGGGGASDGQS